MSITHEPRRQRYVVTVGPVRRLSTYGEGLPRAEALAFARELERELVRKAEIAAAFAEEAALAAIEARAVLADEQVEAEAEALYTVEPYTLRRANGGTIRTATLVRRGDGKVCRFIEKLPKGEAIRQAAALGERAWR